MVYFGADWCPPCNMMKEEVFTDLKVIAASSKLIWVYVDVDEDSFLANRYGISGVPTLVFITPQEEELFRRVGFRDVPEILEDISNAVEQYDKGEITQEEENSTSGYSSSLFIITIISAVMVYGVKRRYY